MITIRRRRPAATQVSIEPAATDTSPSASYAGDHHTPQSRRRPVSLLAGCALTAAIAVAGCGGSGGYDAAGSARSANSPSPTAARTSAGAIVGLRSTALGRILVDGNGRTLYLFQKDTGTDSKCVGACAAAWPPLTTAGKPIAGAAVSPAKLATTRRSDGSTQVTYNGHPLYYFAGDTAAGQTNGEGSTGFGAEWDVVSAAGNKVESPN
jgi:predicted lipoprotein with Yx(FWY)xxD motif